MSQGWIEGLAPLGINAVKEFIDIAPWLVIVMKRTYKFDENGKKRNN